MLVFPHRLAAVGSTWFKHAFGPDWFMVAAE